MGLTPKHRALFAAAYSSQLLRSPRIEGETPAAEGTGTGQEPGKKEAEETGGTEAGPPSDRQRRSAAA